MAMRQGVVVTGAAGGPGRALAVHAASMGFDVAICDVQDVALARTASEVEARGARCYASNFDLTDGARLRAFVDAVDGPIVLLFANAGVLRRGDLLETSPESLRIAVDVNFVAVAETVLSFVPRMRRQQARSRVLLIGSQASFRTFPDPGIYSATKQAVRAIAESLRAELAASDALVDVSLVAPGPSEVRSCAMQTLATNQANHRELATRSSRGRWNPSSSPRYSRKSTTEGI
jgi:short-subunit dehydrogenase